MQIVGSRAKHFVHGIGAVSLLTVLLLSACNPQAKKAPSNEAPQGGQTGAAGNQTSKPSTRPVPATQDRPKDSQPTEAPAADEEPKKVSAEDKSRAHKLVEKSRDQLDDGQLDAARESIANALMLDPGNATANSYSRQLDSDPTQVLNEATGDPAAAKLCEYIVMPGETLSKITERAYTVELRTTLFVSLARLNEISPPKAVQSGQTIKVPALDCDKLQSKRPATSTASRPPSATKPAPSPKPAPTTRPAPVAKPAPTAPDSAAYQEGVKALNSGNKAKAFAAFKKAADADPADLRAQASYRKLLQERDDWYRQCAASRTARDFKKAVDTCGKVLAIDPNHEMAGRHRREAERLLSPS